MVTFIHLIFIFLIKTKVGSFFTKFYIIRISLIICDDNQLQKIKLF